MNLTTYPKLSEKIYRQVLPNGLQVMVVPRPGIQRKLAYFATDFGSIHREFTLDGVQYSVPAGIAHFLEHKMFDLPGRDVPAEFAAAGAYYNAFTAYDMTAYYFSCTNHFDRCLDLLLEYVSTPYFTQESVEKEFGIIDQEIGMYQDSPDSNVFEAMVDSMYRYHDIRTPILGTSSSIRQITPELLELCHRAFYTPGNMLLCVVGDVDPEQVVQIARNRLGDTPGSLGQKQPVEPEELTTQRGYCSCRMEISMPTFQLGFKCEPLGKGKEAVRQEFVADMAAEALFGEASELYAQLYSTGVIDGSFGGGMETLDGCAILTCGGDSDEPEEVRSAILRHAEKLLAEGIPEERLLRMKRSVMGRRLRGLDDPDSLCFRLCAYHFAGFDYMQFPELYEQITQEDLLEFIRRVVRIERCTLSVIYPNKEENDNE